MIENDNASVYHLVFRNEEWHMRKEIPIRIKQTDEVGFIVVVLGKIDLIESKWNVQAKRMMAAREMAVEIKIFE